MGIFEDDKRIAVSKADAIKLGATRYRTGKICKWGHLAERLVSNGNCIECLRRDREAARIRKKRAKYDRKFKDQMGL